ncbi:MAG: lysophospholipid acyltransferase family protein [Phycisphaerales bacterium]
MKVAACNGKGLSGSTDRATHAWQSEAPSTRRWAAARWLALLYWGAERAPWAANFSMSFFIASAWLFSPRLRARTLDNAKWLLGCESTQKERSRLAKAVIRNCYRFVLDVARARREPMEVLRSRIESTHGEEHYQQARRTGRGLIVATAHLGSFEVGAAALRDLEPNARIHIVFRRDLSGRFDDVRRELHEHLGLTEAPVDEGLNTWLQLRDALAKDDLVLIQADRVMPGDKGMRVPFIGGHILLPSGPVKLAALSGAPLLPVFALRERNGKIRLVIERPLNVENDRAAMHDRLVDLATVIEKHVRAQPEQWLMLHRVWCEDVEVEPGEER